MFGLKILKVVGKSMEPIIPENSYVLISSKYKYKSKSIFIFVHNVYGKLIKRLKLKDHDGNLWFEGENPNSVSSENIGSINKSSVIGRICLVITKKRIFLV